MTHAYTLPSSYIAPAKMVSDPRLQGKEDPDAYIGALLYQAITDAQTFPHLYQTACAVSEDRLEEALAEWATDQRDELIPEMGLYTLAGCLQVLRPIADVLEMTAQLDDETDVECMMYELFEVLMDRDYHAPTDTEDELCSRIWMHFCYNVAEC